jgi:hypothetical protein
MEENMEAITTTREAIKRDSSDTWTRRADQRRTVPFAG